MSTNTNTNTTTTNNNQQEIILLNNGQDVLSSDIVRVVEIGHVIENPFDSEWSQDLLDITRLHSSIEADVQDAMSYRYLTNEPIEEDEEGNDDKKDDTKDVPFVFIG